MNRLFETPATVCAHIHDRGFHKHYTIWIHHGEKYPTSRTNDFSHPTTTNTPTRNEMFDVIDDVMAERNTNEEDLDEGGSSEDHDFDALFEELNTELYPGCTWISSLHFQAKLLHIKAISKWTDSSVNLLLELLRISLPKENKIPASHYEAKRKLRKIGLGYQSIHACKNDYCLFWEENSSLQNCPICKESRWVDQRAKGKKVPHKVLRYFPLTPRLRRKYSSRHTAKDMTWHYTGCSDDGMMRHPVDGKAWKEFDKRYPEFAKEPRNIRLGLAADGFNPFGHMSQTYSMWPVVLTTYNMPPWLCMKESSFMLTLLIPGPKSPAKDMDVFLRPLVDELKILWAKGVQTRDASTNTIFRMRATLMWTINDYPARSSLSGWSGQGYKGCLTCNEDTPSCRVLGKTAYVGHRRFLHSRHQMRNSLLFNGKREKKPCPRRFTNEDILKQLGRLPSRVLGKHPSHGGVQRRRDPAVELNWTKRSIFFELPYWSSLHLKHNLDVMHIEKNICESLLGTFLMNDKSKDTDKARQDLEELGIRRELWLEKKNNKTIKPHPPFSFTPEHRERFCQFIKGVRLPDGFGSNFKKKVLDNNTDIMGLKSHDYHILMQRLLPIGARA